MYASGGWPNTSADRRSPASLVRTVSCCSGLEYCLPSTVTVTGGMRMVPTRSGVISTA